MGERGGLSLGFGPTQIPGTFMPSPERGDP